MGHHASDREGQLSPAAFETIVAPATPPGRGGIGIVRLSGPLARPIVSAICSAEPQPRIATLRDFRAGDGQLIDRGIVLSFPAPHSFTGEDVCELHAHGGPVVIDLLVQAALARGARLARPGEFSERAFLNGKLDLAQAEAIADLIDSASVQAAHNAARSLQGVFSRHIDMLLEELIALRSFVEAAIDFPEEEIDFITGSDVEHRLVALIEQIAAIRATAARGAVLRDGIHIVLAGRPNAGKSSLLNHLAGRDTAIVSAVPGTTRDVLREQITLDGLPLHLADTAGLRESADEVEREGIRRALAEVGRADRLLLIIDSTAAYDVPSLIEQHFATLDAELPPLTVVLNKCDLSGLAPGPVPGTRPPAIALSAQTGAGVDALCEHLKACVGFSGDSGEFSARRRHLDALDRTGVALCEGLERLREDAAAELLAEHLRAAQSALGEITGVFGADQLLGRIFSSFCIGK